jgi:MinD-like ATPase involved in chromosome partitioning or flagellar assembly
MSAAEPTVALVFSPEAWVEDLHRHLSHHGGARVRQVVVEPAVALAEQYDVLVVSDRWPALTLRFVGAVHDRSRRVLGVFDPEEPAGKDHLVALGVDATIAGDADVSEFVTVLAQLGPERGLTVAERARPATRIDADEGDVCGAVVAVCGPRGSGVTEVALGLAVALAHRRARSVVLVDAHEAAPALAGRLGLGLEPNLRSAVDACAHGLGAVVDCEVPVFAERGVLVAVPGHPSAIAAAQVTTQDVLDVVHEVRRHHDVVVIDLEERSATARAACGTADAVVGVIGASPVGVVRALEWVTEDVGRAATRPLHLVVNRAPRSRFRRDEIQAEIERTIRPASLGWCPHDRAVEAAAWDGAPVGRGGFVVSCERLAEAVDPPADRRRRRWAR